MEKLRIVIAAVLSTHPYSAGMTWNWMSVACGLRELGHRVTFVEEIDDAWLTDASGHRASYDRSANKARFAETVGRFGLAPNACQILRGTRITSGMPYQRLVSQCAEADLLINMSGHLTTEELLRGPRVRAYVDQDPVYTQIWLTRYGSDLGLASHDVFFTVGLNIGSDRSVIPAGDVEWRPLLPTVVLRQWPVVEIEPTSALTTIASWSGYGDVELDGVWYRSKYVEFRRFAALPQRVRPAMVVLLKSFDEHDGDIRSMREMGWRVDRADAVGGLGAYQSFISSSLGEIGIAKQAYVRSRSGWFSDRAAHYLASSRPVVAQSTGFEDVLPAGHGLHVFRTEDEAVAAIERLVADPRGESRAAREFAAAYLDHRIVLPAFLDVALSSAGTEGNGGVG